MSPYHKALWKYRLVGLLYSIVICTIVWFIEPKVHNWTMIPIGLSITLLIICIRGQD